MKDRINLQTEESISYKQGLLEYLNQHDLIIEDLAVDFLRKIASRLGLGVKKDGTTQNKDKSLLVTEIKTFLHLEGDNHHETQTI